MQGKGRPIISAEFQGHRLVAVGGQILRGKWATMHDFLFYYIRSILAGDWARHEASLPEIEQHPILQWHRALVESQNSQSTITTGEYKSVEINGAVAAYLSLAYNLYTLAHNVSVQSELVRRLKVKTLFHGAYYEAFVAATFIRAGFDIEFEDEQNNLDTHVEFTATHKTTKRKYSVECKARHISGILGASKGARDPSTLLVHNQLKSALKKTARHARVIFIDVNVPDDATSDVEKTWFEAATTSVSTHENLLINGEPTPQAYVVLTNLPFHHHPEASGFRISAVGVGYKIPDFRTGNHFADLNDAIAARKKHSDILQLISDVTDQIVPATFDGRLPEVAFGLATIPEIGSRIEYEREDEKLTGVIEDAVASESTSSAHLVVRCENGERHIVSTDLSSHEISAYKREPETFFGTFKELPMKSDDPVDHYFFVEATYRHTTREKLLEFMSGSSDYDRLVHLSKEDLLHQYCLRIAQSMRAHRARE